MNSAARVVRLLLLLLTAANLPGLASADTYTFFNPSQTAATVTSSVNSVTIQSGEYRFTYTVDGYWSAWPGGPPTGRFFSVFWPDGVQAQAITAGSLSGKGADITIKRADGKRFGLQAFTGKLLANTAATGGAFEVMPQLDGEDALNDPLLLDATGYGGQSFSHTPNLDNYDTYKIHLWVDWALTALTLIDKNPPSQPTGFTVSAAATPASAGTVAGGGIYPNNAPCTLTASANPGWAFQEWTENGNPVSPLPSYTFNVTGNHTLTANFVANQPPVAVGGDFYQLSGQPLAISIYDLMAFDFDPDGGPVSFVSAGPLTGNGAPLTVDLPTMRILVPAGTVADTFSYTIQDDLGSTATGLATISIITRANGQVTGLDVNSAPDAVTVSFTGVPWYSYTAQRADNPAFTGTVRSWSVQAWADGTVSLWDDFLDLGGRPPHAFYRLAYP